MNEQTHEHSHEGVCMISAQKGQEQWAVHIPDPCQELD